MQPAPVGGQLASVVKSRSHVTVAGVSVVRAAKVALATSEMIVHASLKVIGALIATDSTPGRSPSVIGSVATPVTVSVRPRALQVTEALTRFASAGARSGGVDAGGCEQKSAVRAPG